MTAQRTNDTHEQSGPLWDRVPPANRGRSAVLDRAEIAHTALAIADAENLSAASIKRVATRLRVPAVRLGQYLTTRDDLFDLMLDTCLGEIVLPDADTDLGWRAELHALADEIYRLAREHRCLVELISGRSPSGPNGLRFVERALAAFEPTGLGIRVSALYFNALLSFVCGSVGMEAQRGRSTPAQRRRAADDADYLTQAVSAEMYPWLTALFADAPDLTSEESFAEGLACLLDGIEARVGRDGGSGRGR